MAISLTNETVLKPTSWCVVREQEEQYLIYNRRTDELHLLPPTGYFVLQLFDGSNTVADIEKRLVNELHIDETDLRGVLHNFLDKLVVRGIVEIGSYG